MTEPMNNVCAYVLRHCDESPDRVAIDLGHAAVTLAELGGMVAGMANRLREEGLVKGDLVMLTADNELSLMVSVLAVSAVGGVCMVLRRMLPATAVDKYALQFRPRLMVTDHHRFSPQGVQRIFLASGDFLHTGSNTTHLVGLTDALAISDNSDPFGLVVGSGSTGQSKVIPVTHREKIARMRIRARVFSFSSVDRVASMTHVEFQVPRRHLFSALSAGSTVMLYPKGGETEVLNMLRSNVTVLSVPAIVLHGLVSRFGGEKGLLRDLRIMYTSGSLTTDELRHEIDRHITPHLHIIYGTNELGWLTMATPDDWRTHPGSIGRPIEGVEMEVVDTHGMPVATGQPGLLRFRTPEIMTEYLDVPDLTRRSFRDGWFYPHDVGSMGADGIVRFIGRADDMMIFNGINVYPLEIERSMRELAGIKDVAALPLRHPVHQDVPVCAVVLQEGSVLDKAQILAWGRSVLGTVAPKHVFIVDQIPRDDSGKLLRPLLRKKISDMLDTAGSQSGQPQGDAS